MEAKLDKLIERLKKEGVEEAKNGAEQILAKAQEEVDSIIKEAEEKSSVIIKEAEEKSRQYRRNSKVAIEQAGRDIIISLKEKILALFDSLLKRDIVRSLDPEMVKKMIFIIISNWSPESEGSVEVLVSKEDKDNLKDLLISELKDKIAGGFELKVHPGLEHGFRIGIKGEDLYYDFSDKGIAEALGLFLNKEIREILNKSLDG
jgi:V/A-type H+/Na+-transporting ATPase subunit E